MFEEWYRKTYPDYDAFLDAFDCIESEEDFESFLEKAFEAGVNAMKEKKDG